MTDGTERRTSVEDAYLGRALGGDGIDISVQRQKVKIGRGFLISDDAGNALAGNVLPRRPPCVRQYRCVAAGRPATSEYPRDVALGGQSHAGEDRTGRVRHGSNHWHRHAGSDLNLLARLGFTLRQSAAEPMQGYGRLQPAS